MAEACSFIKELVPEVVIEKVTIETTGGTPASLTDNPHINEMANYLPVYSTDGMSIVGYESVDGEFEELKNSAGVTIGYKRTTGMEGSESSTEQTSITIQFSIKEVISGGSSGTIASWFGQEDFTKYFSIAIMAQAYNSSDTFEFSTGEKITMAQIVSWTESGAFVQYIATQTGQMAEELDRIKDGFWLEATFNIEETNFKNWMYGQTAFEYISVQDYINTLGNVDTSGPGGTPAPTLKDLYEWGLTTTDTDGSTIFKVPFEVTLNFEIAPDVENILVSVGPQIDMHQLELDYEIDLDGDSSVGRTTDDGDTHRDTYTRYNTYVISGSKTSGRTFSQSGSVLVDLPSAIIADNRNYADIVALPDMHAQTIKVTPGTAIPTQKTKYFSDVYLSEDELGRVKGTFMVDYESILSDNAQYGGFFTNIETGQRTLDRLLTDDVFSSTILAALLDECPIVELAVYRERIDSTFSYQDVYEKELIATIEPVPVPNEDHSGDGPRPNSILLQDTVNYGPAIDPDTSDSDIEPVGRIRERLVQFLDATTRGSFYTGDNVIDGGGIENFNPTIAATDTETSVIVRPIRMFEFQDNSISNLSVGEYRYSVKVKIRDGTQELLGLLASTIEVCVRVAEIYYEIMKPFYKTSSNRIDVDKFVARLEAMTTSGTEEYEHMLAAYGEDVVAVLSYRDEDGNPDIGLPIASSVTSILLLAGKSSDDAFNKAAESLYFSLMPGSASLDSVLGAINVLKDLQSQITVLSGGISPAKRASYQSTTRSAPVGSENHVIEYHSEFKTTIEKSHNKHVGIEYIRSNATNPASLPTDQTSASSLGEYMQSISYTNIEGSRFDEYGFVLAPSYIHLGLAKKYSVNLDSPSATDFASLNELYGGSNPTTGFYGELFRHMTSCGNAVTVSRQSGIGEYATGDSIQFIEKAEANKYIRCGISTDISGPAEDTIQSFVAETAASDDFEELKSIHTQEGDMVGNPDEKTHHYVRTYMTKTKEYPLPTKVMSDPSTGLAAGTVGIFEDLYNSTRYNKHYTFPSHAYILTPSITNPVVLAYTGSDLPTWHMLFKLMNGTLVQVQYLAGYAVKPMYNTDGAQIGQRLCLEAPIWRPLTKEISEYLNASKASNDSSLVCRLKEVNIPELNIVYPESLCLPIYNKHFIISNES